MDHQDLIEKLLRIERLHAGATTPGEREAAAQARQRILDRLRVQEREDPPVEMTFTLPDPWSRKLFLALARRYGLRPYRRPRQHRQTVMIRLSRDFCNQTLWPEFRALSDELQQYLAEVTDRVIAEALQADGSDAAEVREIAAK
jgi:hypothetical protein